MEGKKMKIKCTKIGIDKLYHFIAGDCVALTVLYILILIIILGRSVTLANGICAMFFGALAAGLIKEVFDTTKEDDFFDPIDVLFTTLGSIPMIVLWIGIYIAINQY
jgi:hypothetical protein